jgi:acetyl esterase
MKTAWSFSALLALFAFAPYAAHSQDMSAARARFTSCPGILAAQPDSIEGATSHIYKTAGRELRIHVFAPGEQKQSAPAVLFFFGGSWRTGTVTSFVEQAKAFASQGYVAAVADYRVYCRDQTSPADAVSDAQAAHEWLLANAKTLNVDTRRIVLAGGSAGGHLAATTAMLAAADRKPAALLLFNPAVDMIPLIPLFGLPDDDVRRISPSVLPMKGLPPTIVFHGVADRLVPIDTVRAFCARAKKDKRVCDLQEYAGQDHSFFSLHTVDPRIGASPYDDTMTKALAFAKRYAD